MHRLKRPFSLYVAPLLIFTFLCFSVIPTSAAGYLRQTTIETGNVRMLLNQTEIPSLVQPVYSDGQWYLPVEALGPYLGYQAQFDAAENWLALTTTGSASQPGVSYWAGELARAAYEMEMLERHKASLEQTKSETTQTIVPQLWEYRDDIETRRDMEIFLEETFGRIRNVPVDIVLREGSDSDFRLHLTIEGMDESDFRQIPHRAVTAWLEEMYDALLMLYDANASLQGWLRSERDDDDGETDTLLAFESVYGVRGRLSVTAYGTRQDDDVLTRMRREASSVQDHLMAEAYEVNGVRFTYRISAGHEDLDLIVYIHRQDLSRYLQWTSAQRGAYLRDLAHLTSEINSHLTIYGRVLEESSGNVREVFMLENGNLYGWERHPEEWFDRYELDQWGDEFENERYSTYWERDRWWQDSHWDDVTGDVPLPDLYSDQALVRQQVNLQFFPLLMTVDSQPFHSREEMFVWNGTLYAPLNELADALYLTATAEASSGPIVFVTNPAADVQAYTSMMRQLEETLAALETLRVEVASLQSDAVQAQRSPIVRPYETITSIASLNRYLEDRYSYIEGIYADLQLTRVRAQEYRLRIWIDDEEASSFDQISQFRIENWVRTIQAAIREMYDEHAEVEGWIRSDRYDEIHNEEALYISFKPQSGELTFNFEGHSGQGTQRDIDLDHLLRQLRRNISSFAGRGFSYEGDVLRRNVELRVITNQNRFMDFSPEDKSDYLNDLMEEVRAVYPGLSVDGLIMNSSNAQPFFRFSFEGGEVISTDLLDDLALYLERYESQYEQLRFSFNLREDADGTVRVRMNGSFSQEDQIWRRIDEAAFENWAEDLFQMVANVLRRKATGEVRDRNSQVLLVKTAAP